MASAGLCVEARRPCGPAATPSGVQRLELFQRRYSHFPHPSHLHMSVGALEQLQRSTTGGATPLRCRHGGRRQHRLACRGGGRAALRDRGLRRATVPAQRRGLRLAEQPLGGGAAATAFHAKQGQVSKTTESGESLGRGGFVVRGNRHWYKDLNIELTLGLVAINGIPMPMVGTHAVISDVCQRWIRLTPGTQKKELVATKIAKATGLLQDDVLSALPPGNLALGENKGIFD